MYSNIKKTEIVFYFYFYFQEIMELEEMSYLFRRRKQGGIIEVVNCSN